MLDGHIRERMAKARIKQGVNTDLKRYCNKSVKTGIGNGKIPHNLMGSNWNIIQKMYI